MMTPIKLLLDEESSNNYYIKESFNSLRANVLFMRKDVKTIVLTSCLANEGKSSVCFDLCRSLAEAGKRVLLIDADLRKSVMATRYTEEKGVNGLSHVLSGQVAAKDAIYPTNVTSLDIVFSGPYPPNPTELVGSPAFKEFLDEQRDAYDYIIVDAPPLGLVVDAAVMASACDGSILVISVGHVKYRLAQQVKAQLERSGKSVLGVVLNQIDRGKSVNTSFDPYLSESSSYSVKSKKTK